MRGDCEWPAFRLKEENRWGGHPISTSRGVPTLDYIGSFQRFRVSLARWGGSASGRLFAMTRCFPRDLSQIGEIKTRNHGSSWPKGGHTLMRPIPNISEATVRRGTVPVSVFEMPTLPLGIAVPRQLHLALAADDELTLALPAGRIDPELDIPTRELPSIADYPQLVAFSRHRHGPRPTKRRSIIGVVFLFVVCALMGSAVGMGVGVFMVRGSLF